jgi:hypothetical protein
MEHVTATAAVEASEDDSGPSSSFSLLEYEKASTQASIAQVHFTWCPYSTLIAMQSYIQFSFWCTMYKDMLWTIKLSEQKCKKHSKHQKLVQGMPHLRFQELQQPQPMAYYQLLLLPRQPDPSPNSHLGYLSDLQQPIMPYMIAGYAPSMVHLLPAFAS